MTGLPCPTCSPGVLSRNVIGGPIYASVCLCKATPVIWFVVYVVLSHCTPSYYYIFLVPYLVLYPCYSPLLFPALSLTFLLFTLPFHTPARLVSNHRSLLGEPPFINTLYSTAARSGSTTYMFWDTPWASYCNSSRLYPGAFKIESLATYT